MAQQRGLGPIGPGGRLLHIGPFKTGTTALQSVCAARRGRLLELGVRYPGRALNHRDETASLLGVQRHFHPDGPPGPEAWRALMSELAQDDRRALVSHEVLANLPVEDARRFTDALGPDVTVAVTLRPLAAILPSDWQQQVKSGRVVPDLDRWLDTTLALLEEGEARTDVQRRGDHGALVERWASLVGGPRVAVIVLDRPRALFDAFETLLALPPGALEPSGDADGAESNRGLTLAEIALLRRLGTWAADRGITRAEWGERVLRGPVAALQRRVPGPDEPRPGISAAAAERLRALGAAAADRIAATGAAVSGDLSALAAARGGETADDASPDAVPLDAAAAALIGALEQRSRTPRGPRPGRRARLLDRLRRR